MRGMAVEPEDIASLRISGATAFWHEQEGEVEKGS
jgi:hypothetical protein